MASFSIDAFAKGCKAAMAGAENREQAAKQFLEQTLIDNNPREIVAILDAAIPKDADIGEMIVHNSPELTLLYARVPPRFQSGIHNHTVFACIGQLIGSEVSTLYSRTEDGKGLTTAGTLRSNVGEVVSLSEDAIHHIENPHNETAHSLHIYGGDFNAVMDERSLWDFDNHEEKSFNFQELIKESIKGMKRNQNQTGLDEIAKAIPATKPLVDA
ncbi:MAG: cysteine dioxygenase family protein [Gammaproteobacteria bacterium]|jgi:predicted metal-dependent enzyme (double-stranded beta helix superfamily)